MTIGFIGAGKVGFSLGKYFTDHQITVTGYYSSNPTSAREAAEFTGTRCYIQLDDLVRDSEVIFITTPDGAIAHVWEELKSLQISDRVICHCSGVLSSDIFSDITDYRCSGYSIHPLLAVHDKLHSYREFSNALFTIEGNGNYVTVFRSLLEHCGNQVLSLQAEDKIRYHAAAVLASNLVLGLVETAADELTRCGFPRDTALHALAPFVSANASHLLTESLEHSLTGPVERADLLTVQKHLDKLSGDDREIYRLLSKKTLDIARRKNTTRDYSDLESLLAHADSIQGKGE